MNTQHTPHTDDSMERMAAAMVAGSGGMLIAIGVLSNVLFLAPYYIGGGMIGIGVLALVIAAVQTHFKKGYARTTLTVLLVLASFAAFGYLANSMLPDIVNAVRHTTGQ